jgi:hypothetical protein
MQREERCYLVPVGYLYATGTVQVSPMDGSCVLLCGRMVDGRRSSLASTVHTVR